jgi:hypothetical protein
LAAIRFDRWRRRKKEKQKGKQQRKKKNPLSCSSGIHPLLKRSATRQTSGKQLPGRQQAAKEEGQKHFSFFFFFFFFYHILS